MIRSCRIDVARICPALRIADEKSPRRREQPVAIARRLRDRRGRALGREHQRGVGFRRQVLDQRSRLRPGLLEQLVAAGLARGAAQAGRIVEHDDRALRPRGRRRQVGADLGEGLGEHQRQRRGDRRAQQKEQDLAQAPARRDLALGAQQKLHRREAHRVRTPLANAVDQPGQDRGGEAE
jgi:hypothetical protein